ncbi:MAG: hypothetical protein PSV35_02160, partial [bacterium]|nr:hypothetical protein [bacterium]
FIPWDTKKSPFNIVKSQLIHKSSSDEHFKLAKDDASTTSMNTDKPLSVRCLTFFCGGNSSDSEDEQKQLKP